VRTPIRRLTAWPVRALAAAAALVVLVLGPLTGAYAHEDLLSSLPADGSAGPAPTAVELVLTAPPLTVGAQVVVSGPAGPVASAAPVVDGDRLAAAFPEGLPPGEYRVAWQVTAADGHPVTGELGFTVTPLPAATAEPDPSPQPAGTAEPEPAEDADAPVGAGPADRAATGVAVSPLAAGVVAVGAVAAGWLVVRRP
jgi:methionine-rich copper-binding protein CopC